MSELETFRDRIRRISPSWLQHGRAEKYLYAFGLMLDGFADVAVAGVKLRFPGLYSFESLSLLGRERRIVRGLLETPSAYAERLRRWRVDHRRRGNPYALLSQLWTHYTPSSFPIDLVYYSGRRFAMDGTGGVVRSTTSWSPDLDTARWARWWLFFLTDAWALDEPTALELEDLRQIPKQWNAAHAIGHIILFPSDAELWDYPPGHTWNESGVWDTTGVPRYLSVDDD